MLPIKQNGPHNLAQSTLELRKTRVPGVKAVAPTDDATADWKTPWDPKADKKCNAGGRYYENESLTCCAYDRSKIFAFTKERGEHPSIYDVLQVGQDMYYGKINGFVMPRLPGGAWPNPGDGTILCIAGGVTVDGGLVATGTYKHYKTVPLLDCLQTLTWEKLSPSDLEVYNVPGSTLADIWICIAYGMYGNTPEGMDLTHYKGSCKYDEFSADYYDDHGVTGWVDEDGNTVKVRLVCTEGTDDPEDNNVPDCPNAVNIKNPKTGVTKTLKAWRQGPIGTRGVGCYLANPPAPPHPGNRCLEHPEQCTPDYCTNHPDDAYCKCLKDPNDPSCKDSNYCDNHPDDPICQSFQPIIPPVDWTEKLMEWLQENGYTLAYVEYCAVGCLPAIYLTAHNHNFFILGGYITSAFIAPLIWVRIARWWNEDPNRLAWAWDVYKDITNFWNDPTALFTDHPYFMISLFGYGGSIGIPTLGYKYGLPQFVDSKLMTFGFVGTTLALFITAIWEEGIDGMANLLAKFIEALGEGAGDLFKHLFGF